ncbi:Glucanase [Mycena chlorophos]|uniref:Glucanase n=1 Tax=Mycena chlorophos TaxID=658473 RepID=A0A8H6SB46_MYCCL|nr:Glucanase [Mycena chlorophos]
MSPTALFALAALLPAALGQLAGTNTAENHPSLSWQTCTGTGGNSCTSNSGSVVIDANWRWTHEGTSGGNALTLKFVTFGQQENIGSRVYLLNSGGTAYQPFDFVNKEFVPLTHHSFDVDVSQLPCGLNGALYFVQMDTDGGVAKSNGLNKAGPKYGTGYCDSQCPRDLKFIQGLANNVGWVPSANDSNSGTGNMGTCCPEMDIWEANSVSTALTPHTCTTLGQSTCTGSACSAPNVTSGTCDQSGCDFNPYRMGVTNFFGPHETIDTTQKMTVVTQFIGSPITQIKRFYVQNGVVHGNPNSTISGVSGNSITDSFCAAQKSAFGDTNTFAQKGGMSGMSSAASAGMVLVMSLWDDHAADMLWLDAPLPADQIRFFSRRDECCTGSRGTCSSSSGQPSQVESQSANAQVVFSNIKFGPIGSTFNQGSAQ